MHQSRQMLKVREVVQDVQRHHPQRPIRAVRYSGAADRATLHGDTDTACVENPDEHQQPEDHEPSPTHDFSPDPYALPSPLLLA